MLGKVGYQTDDIAVVYLFQFTPDALVVRDDSPLKGVEDFIAQAKKSPGSVTVGGSGTNTASHIAHLAFDRATGIKTTYIPFAGTAPTTTALLGGQVQAQWGYTTVGAEQGNKVRMLAVAMESRHPLFPNVPTFREKGIEFVRGAYRGVAVPKDTPEAVRKQVSDLFARLNSDPGFIKKMADGGYVLTNVGSSDAKAFIDKLAKDYAQLADQLKKD
jgi:tripartite-type tricarboxylate transporter receptor subunit TctC